MPEVSIIMPVYNAEKYLSSALKCLTNQTYRNFEVICINDGSTDSSLEILEKAAKHDRRIRVISQENSGQSGGRNTGLEKVRGDFVMFMDNDDLLHPQAVEVLANEADLSDADIVCFGHRRISESGTMAGYDGMKRHQKGRSLHPFLSLCSKKISIMPWAKLYRKELIKDFRFPKVPLGEDYYSSSILFSKARKVSLLRHRFYFHRQFESSQSGTISVEKAKSVFGVADTLFEYFSKNPLTPKEHKAFRKYSARYQIYGVLISAFKSQNSDVFDVIRECWNNQKNLSLADLSFGKRKVMTQIASGQYKEAFRLYRLFERIKI